MQRWITFLVGVGVIVLAVVLMVKGFGAPRGKVAAGDAGADAVAAASSETPTAETPDASDVLALDDGGLPELPPPLPRDTRDGGAGYVMPDGQPVPPLPPNAPRRVSAGVILVAYAGSQGAIRSARSKTAAKELADKIAAEAKTDFHAAAQKGDVGFDRVGWIERGSLEPATEYILFTTPPGGVTEVVDTPAGYWIAKRIE